MKRVLIIEDDNITAHIYKSRLEKAHYKVEVANDGQSGFYRLHENQPDAVLMDMMLPKMNGVDILRKIRAQIRFRSLPILVFTNAYVPNMVQDAQDAGASFVFNKSTLTPRQLLDSLSDALGLSAKPTTPAPSPSAPAQSDPLAGADARFQGPESEAPEARTDELQDFLATAPAKLATLRKMLIDFNKAQEDSQRLNILTQLYAEVHALTGGAGLAGLADLAQMAAALEVLLKELYEKPKNLNLSTLRTMTHGIDFLGHLLRYDTHSDLLTVPANILVVDDETLSRRAVVFALEKAGLTSTNLDDPQAALELVEKQAYDLIFLDVQMPGLDGFELCSRIRTHALNRLTPVIFVTSLADFSNRARSSLSGGTDFIAKPFLFIELSVKALIHILSRRLKIR